MDLPDLWFGTVQPLDRACPRRSGAAFAAGDAADLTRSRRQTANRRRGHRTPERDRRAHARRPGTRVAVAYLTTPRLVGRKRSSPGRESASLVAAAAHGGTVVIEGDPGVGRTRALDACVAEAKRVGAVVVRATASHGASRDFGVAATLVSPADARAARTVPRGSACRSARSSLRCCPSCAARAIPERPIERRHVQAAFRDWLLGSRAAPPLDARRRRHRAASTNRRPRCSACWRTTSSGASLLIAVTRTARKRRGARGRRLDAARSELPARGAVGVGDRGAGSQRVRRRGKRGRCRAEGARRRARQSARYDAALAAPGRARRRALRRRGLAAARRARRSGSPELDAVGVRCASCPSVSPEARELAEALGAHRSGLDRAPGLLRADGRTRCRQAVCRARRAGAGRRSAAGRRSLPFFGAHRGVSPRAECMAPERKRALHARLADLAGRRAAPIRRLHHLLESGQEALGDRRAGQQDRHRCPRLLETNGRPAGARDRGERAAGRARGQPAGDEAAHRRRQRDHRRPTGISAPCPWRARAPAP